MILFELISEALRNLGRHKLRSFLTALGIIFGIASVISMVSLGEGARRAILAQIGELGIRNIIVNSVKPPAEEKETKDDDNWVQRYGLTFEDYQRIKDTLPLFDQVHPVHDVKHWIWFKSRRMAAKVRGVHPSYLENLDLTPVMGRTLSKLDGEKRRRVCIVRARLLREAAYMGNPLELDLKIGGNHFRVIGVLPDLELQGTNQTVLGIDKRAFEVYAPYETVIDRYGLESRQTLGSDTGGRTRVELDQIVCRVADQDNVIPAAKCVDTLLQHSHDKQDFQITVPLELLETRERTQAVFNIVLPIIAGISLLVGGIGILNIMLASITERTREIGIRRAIGATQGDITVQFLIETVTLAAIGGVLGVGLGAVGVVVLEAFTDWPAVITAWAVLVSLGIACATGILFGIYPARRAAMMNPIEALRHE